MTVQFDLPESTWIAAPEGYEMRINGGEWTTKAQKPKNGDRIEIRILKRRRL